jgi:iron(III) transport system permease protein
LSPPSASTLSADASVAPAALQSGWLGERGGARLTRTAFALALAVCALWPAGYLLSAAWPVLFDGGWLVHFATTSVPRQARNSVSVAFEAAAVALAVGAVPALMVSRFAFRGRGLVSALALLPLLYAPYVTAGTWTIGFSWAFLESRHALAIQHGLAGSAYAFIVFRIASARVPRAFGELAAALGHGPWQRLWRVHAPAYAVPLAATLLIVFAQVIGDYAAAERLGIDTLSVGMHNLWLASQSSDVAAVVSVLLIVPSLLLVVVGAWAGTAIMSQNPIAPAAAAASRRRLSGPMTCAVVGWSLLCSLPAFWIPQWLTVRWAWRHWERTNFAAIPGDVARALTTSATTAILVLAICALTIVVLRSGGRSRWVERMPWLFLSNYFLPSLVLALAFVMMSRDGSTLASWLGSARDSRVLIVFTEVLRFMPFAMLPLLDALRRTPQAMIETAQAFGASPLRARWVAFAGHVRPALLLGCALVFMESLKELDLTLMLQPFGYSSPALKIYAFSRNQNMDRAAIWVLISQALMAAPIGFLWWRMRRIEALHHA